MAEENQNNSPVDPASLSVKRKRGRPRKDDISGSDSARKVSRRSGQTALVGDVSVGQPVSGVLDGKFDAGYMLTVTVGNTGTVLTGVVFEPGRCVPISAANDIAPHVEMLKRADIPIPLMKPLNQPKNVAPTNHLKETFLRPIPEDLNAKPSIGSSLDLSQVQICESPVPSNEAHDSDGHVNLNEPSASQPSASEQKLVLAIETLKELQGSETSDKQVQLQGAINNSPIDSLPEEVVQTSNPEPVKIKIDDASDDKPVVKNQKFVLIKEEMADPTMTFQAAVESVDYSKERTLDLFGEKAGSLQSQELSVEVSSGKDTDNILMENLDVGQFTGIAIQNSESESLPKDLNDRLESQEPDLKPQTCPSQTTIQQFQSDTASTSCDDNQSCNVIEGPKDVDPQTAVADTGFDMA